MTDLKDVADKAGLSAVALIKLCLQAGLAQIRADDFAVFKLREDAIKNAVLISDRFDDSEIETEMLAPHSPGSNGIRDIREVAYYADDTMEAGVTSGIAPGNAPSMIPVPAGWNLPVDFVIKVHGTSMRGFVEDGDLAAFTYVKRAKNGQVVAAVVDGQILVKLYNDDGDGQPELRSINSTIKPIPVTEDVLVQGLYRGKFPALAAGKKPRNKH